MRADAEAIRVALRRHERFGGYQFMRQILDLAQRNITDQIAQARRGVESGDVQALGTSLHSIAGSAGNLGAEGLAHDARAGLEMLQAGQVEAAAARLRVLEAGWTEVLAILAAEIAAARPTVAIIEDNADNRLLLRAILRQHYHLLEYAGSLEALAQLEHETPDLVLLDISLPVMDGRQVLRRLRADARLCRVPVVALTAHAMLGDREEYLHLGFDDYVAKPITDIAAFKKRIAELVQRSADAQPPAAP